MNRNNLHQTTRYENLSYEKHMLKTDQLSEGLNNWELAIERLFLFKPLYIL